MRTVHETHELALVVREIAVQLDPGAADEAGGELDVEVAGLEEEGGGWEIGLELLFELQRLREERDGVVEGRDVLHVAAAVSRDVVDAHEAVQVLGLGLAVGDALLEALDRGGHGGGGGHVMNSAVNVARWRPVKERVIRTSQMRSDSQL